MMIVALNALTTKNQPAFCHELKNMITFVTITYIL